MSTSIHPHALMWTSIKKGWSCCLYIFFTPNFTLHSTSVISMSTTSKQNQNKTNPPYLEHVIETRGRRILHQYLLQQGVHSIHGVRQQFLHFHGFIVILFPAFLGQHAVHRQAEDTVCCALHQVKHLSVWHWGIQFAVCVLRVIELDTRITKQIKFEGLNYKWR